MTEDCFHKITFNDLDGNKSSWIKKMDAKNAKLFQKLFVKYNCFENIKINLVL